MGAQRGHLCLQARWVMMPCMQTLHALDSVTGAPSPLSSVWSLLLLGNQLEILVP